MPIENILAPRAIEKLNGVDEWLKSLVAPRQLPVPVEPEQMKTASPSAVNDSRLIRFIKDFKSKMNEQPTISDEETAGALGAYRGEAAPMRPTGAPGLALPGGGSPSAGALTFDQEFPAGPIQGPPAPRRASVPQRGVAASAGALGGVPVAGKPEPAGGASMVGNVAAPAQVADAEPARKSLVDMYREMTKDLPKEAKGDLTPEQKQRMQMDFFLNMMARSSKPGSYMLGAAGESGLDTSKAMTDQENRNYDRSDRSNNKARDEAMRLLGLEDKDQDNVRADRREGRAEKRADADFALRKQIFEDGRWKPVNNGKTGTIVMVNTNGEIKDTGIKIDRGDTRTAEERLVDRAQKDPKFLETLLALKGKGGDITESGQFRAALDLIKGDLSGTMTGDQAAEKVRGLAGAVSGRQPGNAGGVAQPKTQADFDKLPKGAKFINPSDGKEYTKK